MRITEGIRNRLHAAAKAAVEKRLDLFKTMPMGPGLIGAITGCATQAIVIEMAKIEAENAAEQPQ